jgi:hypothetical protein
MKRIKALIITAAAGLVITIAGSIALDSGSAQAAPPAQIPPIVERVQVCLLPNFLNRTLTIASPAATMLVRLGLATQGACNG